jgi:hypothetical protein
MSSIKKARLDNQEIVRAIPDYSNPTSSNQIEAQDNSSSQNNYPIPTLMSQPLTPINKPILSDINNNMPTIPVFNPYYLNTNFGSNAVSNLQNRTFVTNQQIQQHHLNSLSIPILNMFAHQQYPNPVPTNYSNFTPFINNNNNNVNHFYNDNNVTYSNDFNTNYNYNNQGNTYSDFTSNSKKRKTRDN